ncbi:MAG: hypothetical protein KJ941_03810 [Bacteroidetes bacterium]|nr:hypothetical protein [Bacteroidota bacterium]
MSADSYLITFEFLGLKLQEPMALLTNWSIAGFALYAFFNLKPNDDEFKDHWRTFFGILAVSMFLSGLGHLFYQYSGIIGKIPTWILGVLAGCYALFAMFTYYDEKKAQKYRLTVWLYSALIIVLAISLQSFVFVAIDAILKYILCGCMAFHWFKRGEENLRWISLGVLILLPSAFIFLMKINPHIWFNKDDLSHVLMLGCIIFFYKAVKEQKLISVEAR